MQKNDLVRFLHGLRDGFAVKRAERAQIENLNLDSLFGQDVSGFLRGVDHGGIGNDAQVAAFAMHAGFANRHDVAVFRHVFFYAAIEKFVLEEKDGIVVANG